MNTEPSISGRINALRIIVGALIAGIAGFSLIVILARQFADFGAGDALAFFPYVGCGFVAVMIVVQRIAANAIARSGRRRIDPNDSNVDPWLDLFAFRTINGCALLEGAAFFSLITVMLTGNMIGLAAAGLAAAIMVVSYFPSEAKFESFMNEQRELALQERMGD